MNYELYELGVYGYWLIYIISTEFVMLHRGLNVEVHGYTHIIL